MSRFKHKQKEDAGLELNIQLWKQEPSLEEALDSLKTDIEALKVYNGEKCATRWEGTPPRSLSEAIDALCKRLDSLRQDTSLSLTDSNWTSHPKSLEDAIERIANEVATLKGSAIS